MARLKRAARKSVRGAKRGVVESSAADDAALRDPEEAEEPSPAAPSEVDEIAFSEATEAGEELSDLDGNHIEDLKEKDGGSKRDIPAAKWEVGELIGHLNDFSGVQELGAEGGSSDDAENDKKNENAEGSNEVVQDPHLSGTEHLETNSQAPVGMEQNPDKMETLVTESEATKSFEHFGDFSQVHEVGDWEVQTSVDLKDDEINEEDKKEVADASPIGQENEGQIEIKIGGLDTGAVEVDLIDVFKKFGEVRLLRIVKNKATGKSKGFAFLQYATVEQTKNVLSELKDGIEVRGRRVKLSARRKNNTLLIGNISKLWTKEHVIKQLKVYEIEQFKDIHVRDDPENEGRNLGFALLEFDEHGDAVAAVQRLTCPDVFFGCDKSALVVMSPNEEALSLMKTVYVKGLTKSWDEEKLNEIGKQYGEIEEVWLARNFQSICKGFGFITFTSWESALACVDGINQSQFREGEIKVEAEIAKSKSHSRHPKKNRGKNGHSKSKDATRENQRKEQTGKWTEGKGHAVAPENREARSGLRRGQLKPPHDANPVKVGQKRKKTLLRSKDHRKSNLERIRNEGQPKNDLGHAQDKQRKRRSGRKHQSKEQPHAVHSVARHCGSKHAGLMGSYLGNLQGAKSGSKRHQCDMEPHAGYLEPSAKKQAIYHAGYLNHCQGHQGQSLATYSQSASSSRGHPYAACHGSALGTAGLPHAGLLEPAIGKKGYAIYNHRQIRAGGYNGQGGQVSGCAAGSAAPRTYVQDYRSYAGYQGNATVGSYQHGHGGYLANWKLY